MLQDFLSVGVFFVSLVVTVSGLSTDIGQWFSLFHLRGWEDQTPLLVIILGLRRHKGNSLSKQSFNKGKLGKVKVK